LKNNANAKCIFSAKLCHFCEIKKMEKEKKTKNSGSEHVIQKYIAKKTFLK
jgi:hypothetical protein